MKHYCQIPEWTSKSVIGTEHGLIYTCPHLQCLIQWRWNTQVKQWYRFFYPKG